MDGWRNEWMNEWMDEKLETERGRYIARCAEKKEKIREIWR